AQSFARAIAARDSGRLAEEIVSVTSEAFETEGLQTRSIRLPRGVPDVVVDNHIRPSPLDVLSQLRPAFGGVQTGGNSSAIVDGAAAALVCSREYASSRRLLPMAR